MAAEGAALRHRPDIVLLNFDGLGKHVLVDVKTIDAAGATHVNDHHTDRVRLAAHVHAAQLCAAQYAPLPRGFRLVTFAVSTFGSLGPQAQALLATVGVRVGGGVPAALLPESTWAVPRFAPFARMAVGLAVRRGLAESIGERWERRARPAAAPSP